MRQQRNLNRMNRRPGGDRLVGAREALARKAMQMRRPSNIGTSVGSFVPKIAQKAFEKYGFSTVALLTDWAVIVGQDLAQYTRPDKLKWPRQVAIASDVEAGCEGRPGATLILRVLPARALDVQYGVAQIIERINSYFGYRAVADVRILQVPFENASGAIPKRKAPAPAAAKDGQAPRQASPAGGNQADSEDLVAGVVHEKLRDSLRRLQAGISDNGS